MERARVSGDLRHALTPEQATDDQPLLRGQIAQLGNAIRVGQCGHVPDQTNLFDLDGDTIREIDYRETKHFLITRDFLNSPDRFFKHLLGTVDDDGVNG